MNMADNPNTYNPGALLDFLRENLRLKNDKALAGALDIGAPSISKVRSGDQPLSAALLIRMHEVTGLGIRDLRELTGDRRARYRVGHADNWSQEQRAAHACLHGRGGAT